MGNVECPRTGTSHRRTLVKNTFGSSAVVFYECEIIELFPVEFYVISAVHKFEFRLVTNETPNKRRQAFVKNLRRAAIKTHFYRIFYDLPRRRRQCDGLYRGQLHFLE